MNKPKIVLIGGGTATLFAAKQLSANTNCTVHIYEKGKTIGRKFLVAGNGGFNLTHEATETDLYQHYTQHPFLLDALKNFDSQATRTWLNDLGIPTFVGSSGRVFPEKGIKPIQVLQKIKDALEEAGVQIHCLHEFVGFDAANQPIVRHKKQEFSLDADYYIFALGGASWSITGSNMAWKKHFENIGIKVLNFEASNCGLNVAWTEEFKTAFAGDPLKNIQVSTDYQTVKGEALITTYGLEGNAIYPIIPAIRKQLKNTATAFLNIDLKPHNTHQNLLSKIKGRQIKTKNYAYEFNLSKTQLALAKNFTSKEIYCSPERFIEAIKGLKIPIQSLRPIEEAISTVGGIALTEIQADFSLKSFPNIFVIGEMLDWDAPTGGFLLQGCFATAQTAFNRIHNACHS